MIRRGSFPDGSIHYRLAEKPHTFKRKLPGWNAKIAEQFGKQISASPTLVSHTSRLLGGMFST
jgi:hypothetical protein